MDAIQETEVKKKWLTQKMHVSLSRPQPNGTTQILFFFFYSFDQILISKYLQGQFQILPAPR